MSSKAFKSTCRWQKPSPNHFQINKLRQYFSAKTAPITNAQDCFNYHNKAQGGGGDTEGAGGANCKIKYASTDLLDSATF